MRRLRVIKVVIGLCAGLAAGPVWADSSPFVGRWHWTSAQSIEPVPNDLTAAIIFDQDGRRFFDQDGRHDGFVRHDGGLGHGFAGHGGFGGFGGHGGGAR